MLHAIASHPRFADAARMLAAGTLEDTARDRALFAVCKDSGRYIAAMMAIHLHFDGGLTLPRLKDWCVRTGYLSAGRSRALLQYLRYLGYVEAAPRAQRNAAAHYVPTPAFLNAWRGHFEHPLAAAAAIEPAVQRVRENLAAPRVFESICRAQGEGWIEPTRATAADDPVGRLLHALAGPQILALLVASGTDDAFPPRCAAPVSIAGMARRFAVSRPHVQRVFDAATRGGLIGVAPDGTLLFSERMRAAVTFVYAMQLAQLLAGAARAAEHLPQPARLRAVVSA